jgi:hypothetical protein
VKFTFEEIIMTEAEAKQAIYEAGIEYKAAKTNVARQTAQTKSTDAKTALYAIRNPRIEPAKPTAEQIAITTELNRIRTKAEKLQLTLDELTYLVKQGGF